MTLPTGRKEIDMAKHTQGPWQSNSSVIFGKNDVPVAIVADPNGNANGERIDWPWLYDEDPPPSYVVAESNADLIAAAPDLLEACQAVLAGGVDNGLFEGESQDPEWYIDQLKTAIAKAERS
jgi:hypothetical protein